MNSFVRASFMATSLLSLTGCQVFDTGLKKACGGDCGQEIHVRAPAQKVVVHRDGSQAAEGSCADEKCPPCETKAPCAPVRAAAPPVAQPMMAMGQPAPQMMAPMGAGAPTAGYAAIPTVPMNTALTFTFDWIRIPIPIPRLRTVDVPPETKLSFVQVGAAPAVGAMAAPPMIQQAGFVQPAAMPVQAVGVEAQSDVCIRPEHVAAAAAIVRAQNAAGQSTQAAGGTTAAAAADPRLKLVEELERRCDELEKAKAMQKSPESTWKAHKAGE